MSRARPSKVAQGNKTSSPSPNAGSIRVDNTARSQVHGDTDSVIFHLIVRKFDGIKSELRPYAKRRIDRERGQREARFDGSGQIGGIPRQRSCTVSAATSNDETNLKGTGPCHRPTT